MPSKKKRKLSKAKLEKTLADTVQSVDQPRSADDMLAEGIAEGLLISTIGTKVVKDMLIAQRFSMSELTGRKLRKMLRQKRLE